MLLRLISSIHLEKDDLKPVAPLTIQAESICLVKEALLRQYFAVALWHVSRRPSREDLCATETEESLDLGMAVFFPWVRLTKEIFPFFPFFPFFHSFSFVGSRLDAFLTPL